MTNTDTATKTKRHRHTFTALWWHFGSFGRQDVHVHSCFESFESECRRVVIGEGRDCEPTGNHWRETLKAE
jgi:hypothetical protein